MSTLSFIIYLIFILLPGYLRQLPFLLVPQRKIMTPSLRSQSNVCSVGWDPVSAVTADPASAMPGQGRFLCQTFLVRRQRRRRCLEPAEIVTSHNDTPDASDLSVDHHASRDASVVEPAASDEDLHPDSGDMSRANAGYRPI